MRSTLAITSAMVVMAIVSIFAAGVATAQQPYWAYGQVGAAPPTPPTPPPTGAPPANPAPPNTTPVTVPGSTLQFTRVQITDQFNAGADWFPNDHPTMPPVVAAGRRPDVRRCSFCHYTSGQGRPENAGVAGLPVSYVIQTLKDYKSGARKSADRGRPIPIP
jgi:cytochrome c553